MRESPEASAEPLDDATAYLRNYTAAFARRDAKGISACFVPSAVLELPMIKPTRFMGLDEIKEAHVLAFTNLSEVALETCEIISSASCAMAAGKLTVVCRGKAETHPFAMCADCRPDGLSRVSWYLNSRGYRPWSDKAVL